MSKKNFPSLVCVLDRFEEHQAVLRFSLLKNTQELILPKRYLPEGVKEGEVLFVEFTTSNRAKLKKAHLAQEILTEILRGSND